MQTACASLPSASQCWEGAQARPAPAKRLAAPRDVGQRSVRAAANPRKQQQQQQQQQEEDLPESLPRVAAPAEVPEKDFWEGDRFNIVGDIASFIIPVLAAAAVGVGLFASQTYNEGATVFLDTPRSETDTAKLIPADQLQQAP